MHSSPTPKAEGGACSLRISSHVSFLSLESVSTLSSAAELQREDTARVLAYGVVKLERHWIYNCCQAELVVSKNMSILLSARVFGAVV